MMRSALILIFLLPSVLFASENSELLRVGGTFKVTKLDRADDGLFHIEFSSVQKSGYYDRLYLESDHIHYAVKLGETIRLSAEVLSRSPKGDSAEVGQVLLFLPHAQGVTPVWILSSKSRSRDLRGSRYIEMHAPQSDYHLF